MRRLIVLCFLVFNCGFAFGDNSVLVKKLDRLVKRSGIPARSLGLHIVKLDNGASENQVYAINESKQFIPASLTKIITAGASFDHFHLDHKFVTELFIKGSLHSTKLKGDLILVGGADPAFTSESMWNLVNEFSRSGITEITGDLIVDDTFFDNERFSDGRDDGRVDRAYDAPVGAASFNWNSVNIFTRPGLTVGSKARVFTDPDSGYIKIVNNAKTVAGNIKNISVKRLKKSPTNTFAGEVYVVSGSIGINRKELVSYKNIQQPDIWFGYNLKLFLSQRGIKLNGDVKVGELPRGSQLVADINSRDMASIVSSMMKFSNNFVAEMLTKNLSATKSEQGTMKKGLKKLSDYADRLGLKNYILTSPSGLSRKNSFKAKEFTAILSDIKSNFSIYPEFLASLPIAGVDGTLKRRMKNRTSKKWVRAKTGRLRGVLGLSGYAGNKDNVNLYAFTFVYNGEQALIPKVTTLYDDMATALVDSL